MKNRVGTYREAGLEARWSKTCEGNPYIVVRNPKSKLKHERETWWKVTGTMFGRMEAVGIVDGFEQSVALGDVFSVACR